MILVADIGGTKTIIATAEGESGGIALDSVRRYENAAHDSFEHILTAYFAEIPSLTGIPLCVSVAGPVTDDYCQVTNLPWEIDGAAVALRTGLKRVELINDLVAAGYGLQSVSETDMAEIHEGRGMCLGTRVLISPGTGLGETIVHAVDGRYVPIASEGGHADFAPFDGTTHRLWQFLKSRQKRVAVEDVLSGPGIHNIFCFLTTENGGELGPELKSGLMPDPAAVITTRALEKKDDLSLWTIRLFLDILASEAGNMSLKALPVGGVYLGGGIMPRLLPLVDKMSFLAVFSGKGRHQPLLEQIPIRVVLDTKLPLYGAAAYMSAKYGTD